mgnify:CR=1 FL=1
MADEPHYYAKEAHFFDIDERLARGARFYAERFRAGRGLIKGDMTPNYAILPLKRIGMVRDLMPDVRLVYLRRQIRTCVFCGAEAVLATGSVRWR